MAAGFGRLSKAQASGLRALAGEPQMLGLSWKSEPWVLLASVLRGLLTPGCLQHPTQQ